METLLKQSRIDGKPWNTRSIVIIGILFLFHLIISMVYLENIVWRINYASIYQISQGTPMYKQTTYLEGDQSIWLPPKHFPVYFYFMSFFVKLGFNEIGIRIITWLFLFPLFYFILKLTEIRNEIILILLAIIFFLDPILIEINFIGKFDQFAIMFMMGGIYFSLIEKPTISGFFIALGTLSKFQPFFAFLAIMVYYIVNRKFKHLIRISISCLGTIVLAVLYLYMKYGDGFTQVVIFQSTRKTPNLSMWYYIIPDNYPSEYIILGQLTFYLVLGLISFLLVSERMDHSVLLLTSFYNAGFILGSSQYYSTYSYFFTIPFYPLLIDFIYQGRYREIAVFLTSIFIYFIGLLFCFNSCYPTINPFTIFSQLGIILISISTVAFTLLFGYVGYIEKSYPSSDQLALNPNNESD